MMNMDPDDSPLLANEEGKTEQQPNEDSPHQIHPLLSDEDEKQVPHVTTIFGTIQDWLLEFRYPLGVVFANLVSMIFVALLLHLPAEYFNHFDGGDPWQNFQYKAILSIGLAISLVTFLIDMFLCRQGAQSMEQQMKVTDQDRDSDPAAIDICKLSRKVDASFGCNQSNSAPQATFVVCLLYALYSVAAFKVATNATSLFLVQFVVPNRDLAIKGKCFVGGQHFDHYNDYEERDIASLQMLPEFGSLPADIQKWVAKQDMRRHDGGSKPLNQSLPYIPLADGSLVFTKATGGDREYGYYYNNPKANDDKDKPGVVVYSPGGNSGQMDIKEYLKSEPDNTRNWGWFSENKGVQLIAFPSNPPYSGWCGIFHSGGLLTIQEEIICYNSNRKSDSVYFHRFPLVVESDTRIEGGGGYRSSLYVTDDTLWTVNSKEISWRARGAMKRTSTTRVLLTSYNMETMEKQLVLSKNITKEENAARRRMDNPNCKLFDWIDVLVSLMVLSTVSLQLYRLDVPSCAVPVTAALTLAMNALLDETWAGLLLLGLACGCLYQLVAGKRSNLPWRYVSTEMFIWALYVLQIAASWNFWAQSWNADYWDDFDNRLSIPLLAFLVSATTALLLNHPVFQILAVCFSSVGFLSFLCVFAGINYILVPVVFLTLSLGCFRAGSLMQMYRVHVIVYIGRSCRACGNLCKKLHCSPN